MRLDDLPRDRQAEAGILAEPLVWPVGVEALEDALEGMRRDAGTVVVDDGLDLVADAPQRDAHLAALRRERPGILDQVGDHLPEP